MDSSKKSLLFIIAIFVTPVLLGSLYFFNTERFGIKRSSINYGTLIEPAFPLQSRNLMLSGQPADRKQTLAKKWTLLYIAPDSCDQPCQDSLLLIKRVRLLMNEQMRRVRTLIVVKDDTADVIIKQTQKENPDLVYASVTPTAQAGGQKNSFLAQFPYREKLPIYLIDPLGNLMMVYAQEKPDAKKMIRDLLRLLKYSRLG
jgi:cytochrome oxidase Cu insertion factor (SCO1/SenC/PrrC family)